ncbi:MAG TPA: GspH/FimT family pseudopilin [Verrucomicrobiae bacterium]|nr:GspH/FimT family pseudopilin [Verrucomicrobiae bacterium]
MRIEPGNVGKTCARAFTLIELILVMTLLVIMASFMAPALANFFHGRTLNSEARQLLALTHAGQSRAVSEGMPMLLWVDVKQNSYGLQEETPAPGGDPKAEAFTLDTGLQISVKSDANTPLTAGNLPAIRFLPDGSIDENSPQTLCITDGSGGALWLIESRNRMSYDIRNSDK